MRRNTIIHTVKCYPEYFKPLMDGSKTFEVRENDRIYEVGDYLAVNEFLPEEDPYTLRKNSPKDSGGFDRAADDGYYSGKCALFRITYILDNPQFRKEGTVVLGLARCIIQ